MNYPTVDFPRIIKGWVSGPLRLEDLNGNEMYLTNQDSWDLHDFGPIEMNGKIWGVTHLQMKAKRGWLKTEPDCYHWWWFPVLQKRDAQGNRLPGSERGLYFRKPFSWRWQPAEEKKWVWSKGFLGTHFD